MQIIDIFWGINIASSIILLSIISDNYNYQSLIVYILLIIWMLRLAFHLIIYKIIPSHQDARYQKMVKTSPAKAMLKQYFIQTFFQTIVSTSGYYLISSLSLPSIYFYCLISISIIAILGELVSDLQLQNHLKKSKEICRSGLWKFSRHPNYFFDILFWFSIALIGLNSPLFFLSMIGPSFLFITIYFITGPYSERCSIEKHGEKYKNYIDNVSYFLPLPKK